MQATRDRTVMDAWQNGGVFTDNEGRRREATDGRVLAYWKQRLAGVDPQDPMYDVFNNQVLQLTYAIEQSKADLQHLRGQLSDAGYAAFFKRWAAKVPRHSEFWRQLQRDAARLIESAKAGARASAASAKASAYNNFANRVTGDLINFGVFLREAMVTFAKDHDLNLNTAQAEVQAGLSADIAMNPGKYVQLLRAAPRGWDGQVTVATVADATRDSVRGYSLIAKRAKHDGYISQMTSAETSGQTMAGWASETRVWPVAESMQLATAKFRDVWNDSSSSILDRLAAADQLGATALQLSYSPNLDPGAVAALDADAKRLAGEDPGDAGSFLSSFVGIDITGDAATALAGLRERKALLDANPGAYVYAPVGPDGKFDSTGAGGVDIVARSEVPNSAFTVVIPQASGAVIPVLLPSHDILSVDPVTGKTTNIGKTLSYHLGGQAITVYGVTADDGTVAWSASDPTDGSAFHSKDDKGNLLVQPQAPQVNSNEDIAAALQSQYPGLVLVGADGAIAKSASAPVGGKDSGQKVNVTVSDAGVISASITTTDKDAGTENTTPIDLGNQVTIDPRAVITPSRRVTGDIPGVTSSTSMGASVAVAKENGLTYGELNDSVSDPSFQQSFLAEAGQAYAGPNGAPAPFSDPRITKDWTDLTTITAPGDEGENALVNRGRAGRPQDRWQMDFPGAVQVTAAKQAPTLHLGANELRLPKVPAAYTGQAQRNIDVGVQTGTVSLPTPLPSYMPKPMVTPSVVTTKVVQPTVTPTTTVTPGTTVQPTVTVAPNVQPSYKPPSPTARPRVL
jgi:hypothetical protein